MKVLIAEDDRLTRAGLAELLDREGFDVFEASNGRDALVLFRQARPDLVCLDIMMPNLSGYDVCREIRRTDRTVPILFLSAKSEEIDKVLGLELGADDYLVKPFGAREVIARIRAITRRLAAARAAAMTNSGAGDESFRMGDLRIVPAELRAYRGRQALELTPRDAKMLRLFHDRRGQVLDRNTLFDACWGQDYLPNSRTLDQQISQLRKRIERDPAHPVLILTVHGAGYRYNG